MFEVGDLVQTREKYGSKKVILGYVAIIVDGKIGIQWLNNGPYYDKDLAIYTNENEFIQKVS